MILLNTILFKLRKLTKFSCKFRGLSLISEIFRWYYSSRLETLLITDFDNNLLFHCVLSEHMGSQIFWRGFYSRDQLIFLDQLLKVDMTFVDIGANQGEFTVFVAKRLKKGKVIAFEPVTSLFERLERNVSVNAFTNVTLVQKGLGDRQSLVDIYTAENCFSDGTKHEGLYTIHPIENRSQLCESIEIVKMDDLVEIQNLQKIDVIKIDIEGSELAALRGARKTIEYFKPIILIEVSEVTSRAAGYSAEALLDYLSEIGYDFRLILRNGKIQPILPEQLSEFQNIACFPKP